MKLLTKLIIDLVQSLLCNICTLLFSLGMNNKNKVAEVLEWINCVFKSCCSIANVIFQNLDE